MALNAVTIAAIVAACWAHPQGQAYLAKIDQIEALSISCGNPCCASGAGQGASHGSANIVAVGAALHASEAQAHGSSVTQAQAYPIWAASGGSHGSSTVEGYSDYLQVVISAAYSAGSSTALGIGQSTAYSAGAAQGGGAAQGSGAWFVSVGAVSQGGAQVTGYGGGLVSGAAQSSGYGASAAYSLRVMPAGGSSQGAAATQAEGQSTSTGYGISTGVASVQSVGSPLATGDGAAHGTSYLNAFGIPTTYAFTIGSSLGEATAFGRGSWKTTAYTTEPVALFLSEAGLFTLLEEEAVEVVEEEPDIFVFTPANVGYTLISTAQGFIWTKRGFTSVARLFRHEPLLHVKKSYTICQNRVRDLWILLKTST